MWHGLDSRISHHVQLTFDPIKSAIIYFDTLHSSKHTIMKIPKHFFQDKTVLLLLGINSVLALFAVLYIVLRVDPAEATTRIVQYRSNLGIGAFKSGSTSEIQLIALFVVLQYVFSWVLSVRLYVHRRHMSLVVLSLTTFMLLLTPIVTDALLRVS